MNRSDVALIVSKDAKLRQKLHDICRQLGVDAHKVPSWEVAQARLKNRYYDVVILGIGPSHVSCVEMIQTIRRMGLDSCILVSARFSDSSRIVSCLKTGAYDAILQPLNEEWAAITITRAFERRRYYDQARYTDRSWQLYVFDELTRVHNHRYFHLALEKAIRAAQRYRYAVSLLLIDIDNFKAYNDRHGHIAGDEVLRTLGSFLARSIRASDIVARYGGEEFTVILPHTKKGGAMALAERIREGVAAMQFSTRGPVPSDRLTVSAGVASFPADARTKDELVSKTGLALAKAKRRGRNRVGVC